MQQGSLSVFRKDKTNVGDWWSPPHKYFPLNSAGSVDLIDKDTLPNRPLTYIVGGGGLGNASFAEHLAQLTRSDRAYRLVAWGIGADGAVDRQGLIQRPANFDHLLDYFADFDEVGTRIFLPDGYGARDNYHWVPCASCMSPLFRDLANVQPTQRVGFFSHKRVPLTASGQRASGMEKVLSAFRKGVHFDNRGSNLEQKLGALAQCEFVVTNSYHGVYWATLLGRKVICQPFKDGLYTYRHPPAYLLDGGLEAAMEQAQTYPQALDECRLANIAFYRYLTEKYGDI